MKKILLICEKFMDYNNGFFGHAVRISNFYTELKNHGFDVYVLITDDYSKKGYVYDSSIINFEKPTLNVKNFRSAFHFCIEFIIKNNINIILSTSPTLYTHMIADEIKNHASEKITWLMDIRDLASRHPFLATSNEKAKQFEKLEADFLKKCDVCTVVSYGMKEELLLIAKGSEALSNKINIIENGFLEQKYIKADKRLVRFKNLNKNKIIFIYSGSGTLNENNHNKDLKIFFNAVIEIEHIKDKAAFVLQGPINIDQKTLDHIRRKIDLLILPHTNNQQALSNIRYCDVGLNLNSNKSHANQIIGGKTYDYIGCNIALLLIFPKNATSIKKLSSELDNKPVLADAHDIRDIKNKIIYLCEHNDINALKIPPAMSHNYKRSVQSLKLIDLINNTKPQNNNSQEKFYNEAFSTGGYDQEYFKNYWETSYFLPWSVTIDIIKKENTTNKILDLGCGPGQFASMLTDNNFINYMGIDISSVAINQAKSRNPSIAENFFKLDLTRDIIDFNEVGIIVSLEVIEHIYDDISLIKLIPKGKKFIFSVPNYDSKTHVRIFEDYSKIIDRYSEHIEIKNIYVCEISGKNKKIFIVESLT